ISLISIHLWRLHKDGGMYDVDDQGCPLFHGKNPQEKIEQTVALAKEKTISYSDLLFREVIAIEALAVVLVSVALTWKAPLEQLANPMHTPNPAKAPWYFTGLQELLHYFPPFVAGIILPGLIVSGLIFIPFSPFFDNVKTRQAIEWFHHRAARWAIGAVLIVGMTALLIRVHAWDALLPLWAIVALTSFAAGEVDGPGNGLRRWLQEKPISFWIMTLFLMEAVVLTAVGTFFRGPGWAWVWPWRG